MATGNAIKAQQLLLREAGKSVKVDGVSGPQTKAAVQTLPALQPALKQIEQMFGEAAQLGKLSNVWINVNELIALTHKAAQHVAFTASQIKWMIDMEAEKKRFDGVLHYQVDYDRGGARGLGQFFPPAWLAAQNEIKLLRSTYVLPPFELGWNNAEHAVHAVAFYMMACWDQANKHLRGSGYKTLASPSLDVIYALYNQGPTFAVKSANLGRRPPLVKNVKQSNEAMPVLSRAAEEIIALVV